MDDYWRRRISSEHTRDAVVHSEGFKQCMSCSNGRYFVMLSCYFSAAVLRSGMVASPYRPAHIRFSSPGPTKFKVKENMTWFDSIGVAKTKGLHFPLSLWAVFCSHSRDSEGRRGDPQSKKDHVDICFLVTASSAGHYDKV
jgi:hypothetical protein